MKTFPEWLDLGPFDHAEGRIRLPGSKSISNRALLLAALSEGRTIIEGLLDSDDVQRMLDALRMLGVEVQSDGNSQTSVEGCGGRFPVTRADLYLGNAGTAFRPLTAALALGGGHYRLSGVARMHERPIGDLVDALRTLGADIRYLGAQGFPPLEIHPGNLGNTRQVNVKGDVSSQFLTGLLMALPLTGRETSIEVQGELISKPYVDITLNLMARFGVQVRRSGSGSFVVPAGARYQSPGTYRVEGDASGASYFLAAGAIAGGPVRVEGVGRHSIQGDVRFADALEQLGAGIERGEDWIEARAPASRRLKAFDLDLNHIPDAAMTLAIVALFADGPCRLRNIGSWRVKETDRIAAMATELQKLGAGVEAGADFLVVTPPQASRLTPHARIDTYDDHRMAMCFSLAALGDTVVRVTDPKCVAKTFPDYFECFDDLAWNSRIPVVAIDGPSASGKGAVAQRVAEKLGFHYLESGALDRLTALSALDQGLDLDDQEALGRLAAQLPVEFHDGRIDLDGRDATDLIRAEDVSRAASKIAAFVPVRQGLMRFQRAFCRAPGLVAEGRDMGSVIFPHATLKIFLTASLDERAQRRHKQLIEKGFDANLAALLQDIRQRDERDSARSAAPLHRSADARVLDTTGVSIEDAVSRVLQWLETALRQAPS